MHLLSMAWSNQESRLMLAMACQYLTFKTVSDPICADGVNEPIPTYYQEAGVSRNRGYENQHANELIDPFTGKLQWHYTDLFIPRKQGSGLLLSHLMFMLFLMF